MHFRKHPKIATQIDPKTAALFYRSGASDLPLKERITVLMLKGAVIAFGIIIVLAVLYALRVAGY